MNATVNRNRVIVLFDEFGTPTFRDDRSIDTFLGVSVTYKIGDEGYIFQQCDAEFGLSNIKPVKNDRISASRAEKISELIPVLPILVTISSIDLSNEDLHQVVGLYEDFGTEIRKFHRGARSRVVAQILHDEILDDTLFAAITQHLESDLMSTDFEIYIDDWAIPTSDIHVALEYRSRSLEQKITELYREFGSAIVVNVSPIQCMNQDSKRKRLIDVTTSAISRSFIPRENPRHTPKTLQNLLSVGTNQCDDFTHHTIEFLRRVMDEISRNPHS